MPYTRSEFDVTFATVVIMVYVNLGKGEGRGRGNRQMEGGGIKTQ